MQKSEPNNMCGIVRKISIISFAIIILARISIWLLFYFNINSEMGELMYGTCYVVGLVSIFIFIISLITLITIRLRR